MHSTETLPVKELYLVWLKYETAMSTSQKYFENMIYSISTNYRNRFQATMFSIQNTTLCTLIKSFIYFANIVLHFAHFVI